MTLKMHLEYVRICVSQHILYIWPYVVNDKLERGRGKSIYFWKGLFTWSPKISPAEPQELQEKSYGGRSLKCDVTYQPQLKMPLLLHLWKELLQI